MIEKFLTSLFESLGQFIITYGLKIVGAVLLVLIGFRVVNVIVKKLIKAKWFCALDPIVQSFLKSFISILLKVILVLSAVALIGIAELSITALIGTAGLAVGLAIQGGLANITGGLILMAFKPFGVGDYIESASGSGTVEAIDIFHTIILTPDKKKIIIPNGDISNASVTNYSSEPRRRVDLKFNVAYETNVDFARKVLLAAAANHSLVITGEEEQFEPVVYMTGHGVSGLELSLRVWCDTANYWAVYFELMEDVKKAFDQFEITIPYPQLDVHLDK